MNQKLPIKKKELLTRAELINRARRSVPCDNSQKFNDKKFENFPSLERGTRAYVDFSKLAKKD